MRKINKIVNNKYIKNQKINSIRRTVMKKGIILYAKSKQFWLSALIITENPLALYGYGMLSFIN